METYSIFFCYQSDIEQNNILFRNAGNRIKKLFRKQNIELIIKIGTNKTAGNPPLLSEMLYQAKTSDIFIVDLTYIATRTLARKTKHIPNPNVLLELGHAWNYFDLHHIITIQNDRYGDGRSAPVDLKEFRWSLTFSLSKIKKLPQDKYNKILDDFTSEMYSAINLAIQDIKLKSCDKFSPFIPFNNWVSAKFEKEFKNTEENNIIINKIRQKIINNENIFLKGQKMSGRSRLVYESIKYLDPKIKNNIYVCDAENFPKGDILRILQTLKSNGERLYKFVIINCADSICRTIMDETLYRTSHRLIATMLDTECNQIDALDSYQGFMPEFEREDIQIDKTSILSSKSSIIEFINNNPPRDSRGSVELFYVDLLKNDMRNPDFASSEIGGILFSVLFSNMPKMSFEALGSIITFHPDYNISDNSVIMNSLHRLMEQEIHFEEALDYLCAISMKEGDEFMNIRRFLLPEFKLKSNRDYTKRINGLTIINKRKNYKILIESLRSVFFLDFVTVSVISEKEKQYIKNVIDFIVNNQEHQIYKDLKLVLVESAWVCSLVGLFDYFWDRLRGFIPDSKLEKEEIDRLMWTAVNLKNKGLIRESEILTTFIKEMSQTEIREKMKFCIVDSPYTYAKEGESIIDLVQDFVQYCWNNQDWINHIDILLQGQQRKTYDFAKLIAKVPDDIERIIDNCIEIYKTMPRSERNLSLPIGLLEGKYEEDADAHLRKLRNRMLEIEELKDTAYDLSRNFKQTSGDLNKLIDTQLSDARINTKEFHSFRYCFSSNDEIKQILDKIYANSNYNTFSLSLINEINQVLNPDFDSSRYMIYYISNTNYWNHPQQSYGSDYFYFTNCLTYALCNFKNKDLINLIADSVVKYCNQVYFNSMNSLDRLMSAINHVMLDTFLETIRKYIEEKKFNEERSYCLSKLVNNCMELNIDKIMDWYITGKNRDSLRFLLLSLPLFKDNQEEEFSPCIMSLIEDIEEKDDFLCIDMRINTFSSNGENLLIYRKKAVEKLIQNNKEIVRNWATEEVGRIDRDIKYEQELFQNFHK